MVHVVYEDSSTDTPKQTPVAIEFLKKSIKNYNKLALFIAILTLGVTYVAEYFLALEPCPLCIYQRFPYVLLIYVAIIKWDQQPPNYLSYLLIIGLSVFISGYHTGIERGIFELSSFCKSAVAIPDTTSVDDFVKMLETKKAASCDKPIIMFWGLSITEGNLLFSCFLFIMTLYIANCKLVFNTSKH